MVRKERSFLLLSLIIGLAAAFILTGLLEVSTARAEQQVEVQLQPLPPPPPKDDHLQFIAFFTDDLSIEISDLSGNVVAEGTQLGEVICNGAKCYHKIDVVLTLADVIAAPYTIVYRFADRVAVDLEAERIIVEGTATAGSDAQKEKFRFTAVFKNNFDGTVTATYVSPRPELSFIITAPGSMRFYSR